MSDSKWEVKVIRTTMGDLIGEVDTNAPVGSTLTVRKPHQIRLQQQSEERVGIGFMPYMIYSEDESYDIDRAQVITVANPATDLRNAFNQQFGSGIIVPSGPQMVGNKILLKG